MSNVGPWCGSGAAVELGSRGDDESAPDATVAEEEEDEEEEEEEEGEAGSVGCGEYAEAGEKLHVDMSDLNSGVRFDAVA